MSEWEGSKEQAEFINQQHNAVLDILIAADMWDGAEQYRGKSAAELVQILVDRAEKAEAQLLALQVDAGTLVRLRDDTDNVLWSLKPDDVPGAINWGDLGTRETQEVIDEQRRWYRVIIEEADPANPDLHAAVLAGLDKKGWNVDDLEIETAW